MMPEVLNTIGLISGMVGLLLIPVALESAKIESRRLWLRRFSRWVGPALIFVGAYLVWSNRQIAGKEVDSLAAGGAWCLGLLVGVMVGFFVQETEDWDRRALVSAVGVFTGGGVLAILRWAASLGGREVWFYPMGLVVGFVIGTIWEHAAPPKDEKRADRSKKSAGRSGPTGTH
jgi:hypothetical protein